MTAGETEAQFTKGSRLGKGLPGHTRGRAGQGLSASRESGAVSC